MAKIRNKEQHAGAFSSSGAEEDLRPGMDSDPLPLMSELGEKNAAHAGQQKNWQKDDAIETHAWDSKYGVHPFPKR